MARSARQTGLRRTDPAIDRYLARARPETRAALRQLRKTIHAIVPGCEECISDRLPAFRVKGGIVTGFSARANGCSCHPFSGRTLKTLANELEGYRQTESALHFGPGAPLPRALVRRLLEARLGEIERS